MAPVGYLPAHMPARLTQLLGTRYPIVSAPMGAVAGGRLAAGEIVRRPVAETGAALARLRHGDGGRA